MSLYYLDIAPSGIKMQPYKPRTERSADANPGQIYKGFPTIRGSITMAQLANALSSIVERQVVDRTRLTGRYDVVLSFARPADATRGDAPLFGPPDIPTALQQQLGLKLQSGKDGVTTVIVDRLERSPSDN
jgi:uncharacterized protein (TIGR03435 family)